MRDVEQILGEMRKSGQIPEDGMQFVLDDNSNKNGNSQAMNNISQPFRINLTKELSSHLSIYDQSEDQQKSLANGKQDQPNPRFSSIFQTPQSVLSSHKSGQSIEKRQRISSGLGEDHEDKLFWAVFKDNEQAMKQQDQSKIKMKLQPKYPTTRLLPEGDEENEQMKTLAQSKQLQPRNSSGP